MISNQNEIERKIKSFFYITLIIICNRLKTISYYSYYNAHLVTPSTSFLFCLPH